jgi:hypothetical protein
MNMTIVFRFPRRSSIHPNLSRLLAASSVLALLLFPCAVQCQSTIFCGQLISGKITTPTQIVTTDYNGTAGENISFALQSVDNAIPVSYVFIQADIYAPNGRLIISVSNSKGQFSTNLTLALTGTYTIGLHASSYDDTGSYWLSLQTVTGGGCAGRVLFCGQTANGQITQAAQMVPYAFDGSTGELLSFVLQSDDNAIPESYVFIQADIYDPDGRLITSLNNPKGQYSTNLTLTVTGTYTILLHASTYDDTGTYWFSAQTLTGGGCVGRVLDCGKTANGQITEAAQIVPYAFASISGELLCLVIQSVDNAIPVSYVFIEADIYDPNGRLVTSISDPKGQFSTSLTLALTGTYTILLHSTAYDDTGSYWLTAQTVNDGGCGGRILTCDQTTNGQITEATQIVPYAFSGISGESLGFSLQSVDNAVPRSYVFMEADIYDPNGNLVKSISNPSGQYTADLTLALTGTYTMLLHASAYNDTGSYEFTVTCLDMVSASTTTSDASDLGTIPGAFVVTRGGPIENALTVLYHSRPRTKKS